MEALDPRDILYGGALAIVCLVIPPVVVPMATQTAASKWTDRAVDASGRILREKRPAVRVAIRRNDFTQADARSTIRHTLDKWRRGDG